MGRPKGSKNKPKVAIPVPVVEEEKKQEENIPQEGNNNNSPDRELTEEEKEELGNKYNELFEKSKDYNLSDKVYFMLREEPFFGAISRNLDKIPDYKIPTACVGITPDGYFELRYNPIFMMQLSQEHQIGVLMHEFYHIIFGHLAKRRPEGVNNEKWNHATDLAINSLIANRLPDWTLLPGRDIYFNLPLEKAAEWYMSVIPDPPQNPNGENGKGKPGQGNSGNGQGRIDSHDSWDEASDEARAIAEERCKDMISKAANEAAGGRGWGSLPENCKKIIMARIEAKIDWRKVLRMFIGTTLRGEKKNTPKKLNKKMPYLIPGTKRIRYAKIAVCVDQSGSVSDELLIKFFSELDHLAEFAEFTIIPFDTRVDPGLNEVWKKGQRHKATRKMQGGTDFDSPTEYCNNNGSFEAMLICTDGQAPKPKRSRIPRLWVLCKEDVKSLPFETTERKIVVD